MEGQKCAREGCENTFTPRRGGRPQTYCSTDCRLNRRPPSVVGCARCGESFLPRWRGQRTYCSKQCAAAANLDGSRARIVYVTHPPRKCAGCGSEFVPVPKAGVQRFCTTKCKQRANNARSRRRLLPLTNPNPKPRRCAHCGTEFLPKRRDRTYCYDSWCVQSAYRARKRAGEGPLQRVRAVACDGCGTVFTARNPRARWCSRRCAGRHWGLVKSRQRGQLSEAQYTDLEIFERDGWRCHLCKKLVRRDVPRTHPDGATIDHLVPTALGGRDEPANVATAHRRCNRAKGIRAVGEQLALI